MALVKRIPFYFDLYGQPTYIHTIQVMWSVMVAWHICTRILSFVACAYLHTYIPTYLPLHCTVCMYHAYLFAWTMDALVTQLRLFSSLTATD